jgi:hypothetical protein
MKTKLFEIYQSAALLLLAITLMATIRGFGAGLDLNPTADAFITTGPANSLSVNNYGAAGALALSAPGSSKGEFQSVLRFDASVAKSTFDSAYGAGLWSLQSVTLQLTAASPNNAIFNANSTGLFGVSWMQNDSWTEGAGTPNTPTTTGITFSSLQSTFLNPTADEALGTFSYNGSSSGTFIYTLNLSPALVSDLLAGDNLSLRLFAADSGVSFFSDSRSFGTAASRPFLSITAVPEPGTAALLVLGGSFCLVRAASRCRR